MSTKTINQLLASIFSFNRITYDIPSALIKSLNLPLEATSNTLDGFLPGISDAVGSGLPFSMKLFNMQAPKVLFSKGRFQLLFSVQVKVFDETMAQEWMNLFLHDITLDCDVELEDMVVNLNWNQISMGSAIIYSDVVTIED